MEYSLNNAPLNRELTLKKINYINQDWQIKFANLGFILGEKISIINRPTKHICLVCLRDVVYALDKKQCEQVVVYD